MNPVIYDIRATEINTNMITIGLVGLAAGMLMWCIGRFHDDRELGTRLQRAALLSFLASIPWTVLTTAATFIPQYVDRKKLTENRANVVEGVIANMKPAVENGRKRESFSVSGVTFEYIDTDVAFGFHQYVMNGNPLRNGMSVRIFYSGDSILRIERLPLD